MPPTGLLTLTRGIERHAGRSDGRTAKARLGLAPMKQPLFDFDLRRVSYEHYITEKAAINFPILEAPGESLTGRLGFLSQGISQLHPILLKRANVFTDVCGIDKDVLPKQRRVDTSRDRPSAGPPAYFEQVRSYFQ